MKKMILVLMLVAGSFYSHSQDNLQDCYQSSFFREDSTLNHADRFMIWQSCVNGKAIPSFTVTTLEGKKIKSKDLKGKILVLNFWFIDCLPCIKELPALNKLVEMYKSNKDVVFLAITWEPRERVEKEFLKKHKLLFQVVPDARPIIERFIETGYPTTYVVDRDGKVRGAWLGGPVDAAAETEAITRVKPVVDELLKTK